MGELKQNCHWWGSTVTQRLVMSGLVHMLFYAWFLFLWELLGLISRAVSYILGVVTISFFEWYGQQFISYITSAQGGRMLCHAKPHELHSGTQ